MRGMTPADSLIEPQAAPSLFATEEWRGMEKGGTFTGERLFQQRPEAYRGIVQAVGSGMGIRATAKAFSVSTNTVYAVMEREGVAIDTIKQETLKHLNRAAAVGAERLADALESSPAKMGELAVALGIVVDKMQLLGGEPTSRVEHRTVPAHEDINRFLESLPVASVTVSHEEELDQQARPAGPALASAGGSDTAVTDSKSVNSPFKQASDTGSDTEPEGSPGIQGSALASTASVDEAVQAPEQGEGGVRNCAGGVFSHTGLPLSEFCQGASAAAVVADPQGATQGEV